MGFNPDTSSFESVLSQTGDETPAAGTATSAEAGAPGAPPSAAGSATADQDGMAYPGSAESLEMQMAQMSDNTGRFSALARILSIRERAYENAIRGR